MNKLLRVLIVCWICSSCARSAYCDFIDYTVLTDKATYNPGETVNWTVTLTVTKEANSNFGLSGASINLQDSRGETLTPGSINLAAAPSGFGAYTFANGGDWDPNTNVLLDVGAVLFFQNNANVVGRDGQQMSDLLLAQGSFVATIAGAHTLTVSGGSTNEYFTAEGQLLGNGSAFSTLTFNNANFNVSAVPEPATLSLIGLAAVGFSFSQRRLGRRR